MVVDFSLPYHNDILSLISPAGKGPNLQFWVYVNIFSPSIWIFVGIMMASVAVLYSFLSSEKIILELDRGIAASVLFMLQLKPCETTEFVLNNNNTGHYLY